MSCLTSRFDLIGRYPVAIAVVTAGIFLLTSETASAQNGLGQDGLVVPVENPISGNAIVRIKKQVQDARNNVARPIRTVIFDFTPAGKPAATPDYGFCYDLANYINSLTELKTVAFANAAVSGHTVLPVLACKELVMSREASIGEIVKPGDPFPHSMSQAYDEILGDARAPLQAVVRKMTDPALPLGRGQKNGVEWFIDLRDKDKFVRAGGVVPDPTPLPFAKPGMPGVFPTDKAKQLGLVKVTAETRADAAALFDLNPANLREDPLGDRPPVAFRYILRGTIDGGVKEATRRVVQDVIRQKGTHLFVQIECGDGDLSAARDIADTFQKAEQGQEGLVVVGFVADTATPAGTVIAFGCRELVLSKRSDVRDAAGEAQEAEIGDFEPVLHRGDVNTPEFLRKNLKELAAPHNIPEVLIDGMLDRDLVIIRAHAANERGRRRLMTEQEFDAAKANWVSEGTVKPKGQLLKLNATRAVELGVARFAVDGRDLAAVYPLYGIEPPAVKEATPGWLDKFATFLRLPPVTVLLVVIGFAGLVLELKVPGTTVPGITAALCFILIFWAHTGVNGNAAILGGMLFLLGLVLVLLEVFVIPGFGAPGVLGILFMLGGIGIATLDKIPQTGDEWTDFGGKVGQYMLAMIGSVILAFTVARFLPQIPYANRLMLVPPADRTGTDPAIELPGAALAASLLGAVGSAATALRPAGMAQFGDQYVDVVTEGGFIAAGTRVQVVEVEGTRIVVREV